MTRKLPTKLGRNRNWSPMLKTKQMVIRWGQNFPIRAFLNDSVPGGRKGLLAGKAGLLDNPLCPATRLFTRQSLGLGGDGSSLVPLPRDGEHPSDPSPLMRYHAAKRWVLLRAVFLSTVLLNCCRPFGFCSALESRSSFAFRFYGWIPASPLTATW